MGTNHQQTRSKANSFVTAWGSLAKDESFGDYTLAQFQQLQADAQTEADALAALDAGYTEAMMQRDEAHGTLNEAMLNIVDGVKGNTVKYGADSALYKAMGYVPRSERASGLSRKATSTVGSGDTTTGSANPPASTPAATTGSVKS